MCFTSEGHFIAGNQVSKYLVEFSYKAFLLQWNSSLTSSISRFTGVPGPTHGRSNLQHYIKCAQGGGWCVVETGRALYVKGVWTCLCAYYSICVGLCDGMIKRQWGTVMASKEWEALLFHVVVRTKHGHISDCMHVHAHLQMWMSISQWANLEKCIINLNGNIYIY